VTDELSPDAIARVTDLAAHTWDQMRPILNRAVELGEAPDERIQIATGVAFFAVSSAAGIFGAVSGFGTSDDDLREAMVAILDLIRDMIVALQTKPGEAR